MAFPMLAKIGAGAGIGLLSGLGMGFGYGYGVRAGYNAYKPNKSAAINKQIMSLNPVEAGNGMGRDIASRRVMPLSEPNTINEKTKMDFGHSEGLTGNSYFDKAEYKHPFTKMITSREAIIQTGYNHGLDPKIAIHRYQKGLYPFQTPDRLKYKNRNTR